MRAGLQRRKVYGRGPCKSSGKTRSPIPFGSTVTLIWDLNAELVVVFVLHSRLRHSKEHCCTRKQDSGVQQNTDLETGKACMR